ncbi:hypothetical protein TASIC1_0009009700 [Trichoderma asperellum]|uniref:Uncharacterized protein n=1 Tax=Trichoderma asperellum TaxID=101201 RepID=A0A6V8QZL6_TRIAP|nr:hypothetical protein TASIC1_0009009700 [Trichoderma asperellum]
MKAAILSLFVTASAAFQGSSHATNEISADSICGELGAINLDPNELPGHVSLEDVRMCAQHPLGRNRTLDLSDEASVPPAYLEIPVILGRLTAVAKAIVGRLAVQHPGNGAGLQKVAVTANGNNVQVMKTVALIMLSFPAVPFAGHIADAAVKS